VTVTVTDLVTAGGHVAGAGVTVTVLVTAGGQTAAEVLVVGTAGAGVEVGAAVIGCGCHGVTTG
jgi:hypothetical protein